VLDAGAVVRRDEFAAFDVRLLLANTDQVVAIATITEPA
jgi:hypothetical protein